MTFCFKVEPNLYRETFPQTFEPILTLSLSPNLLHIMANFFSLYVEDNDALIANYNQI